MFKCKKCFMLSDIPDLCKGCRSNFQSVVTQPDAAEHTDRAMDGEVLDVTPDDRLQVLSDAIESYRSRIDNMEFDLIGFEVALEKLAKQLSSCAAEKAATRHGQSGPNRPA